MFTVVVLERWVPKLVLLSPIPDSVQGRETAFLCGVWKGPQDPYPLRWTLKDRCDFITW